MMENDLFQIILKIFCFSEDNMSSNLNFKLKSFH